MTDWLFGVTPGQLALLLGLCALIVVAAGICVAVYGWYTRRTMRRLEQMLEQAIAGSFEQGNYSEARLSRLEEKLSRFLRSSQLSRKSIEEDRGRIKSLIGDISHQTKTPLANILLYGQLLDEQPLPAIRPKPRWQISCSMGSCWTSSRCLPLPAPCWPRSMPRRKSSGF